MRQRASIGASVDIFKADAMDLSSARDFQRFFRVVLADTPELRAVAFGIRYRVYCLEFGYESKERFRDEQEVDQYDPTSLHCLVVHNDSGRPAACVRLVPAVTEQGNRPLPFERNCREHLDLQRIEALRLPRETVCELSRLAVDGKFRRRRGEGSTRFGHTDDLEFGRAEARTLPLIAVSAYLAAVAMTELTSRHNVFAMMEPFLPRLLNRVGLHFEKVGEDIDYHGLRAPYFGRTEVALKTMAPELRDLYTYIRGDVAGSLQEASGVSPGSGAEM